MGEAEIYVPDPHQARELQTALEGASKVSGLFRFASATKQDAPHQDPSQKENPASDTLVLELLEFEADRDSPLTWRYSSFPEAP
jgi:hypothetical protein